MHLSASCGRRPAPIVAFRGLDDSKPEAVTCHAPGRTSIPPGGAHRSAWRAIAAYQLPYGLSPQVGRPATLARASPRNRGNRPVRTKGVARWKSFRSRAYGLAISSALDVAQGASGRSRRGSDRESLIVSRRPRPSMGWGGDSWRASPRD